jgi:nucleotide-binding universal stress UspA family protein
LSRLWLGGVADYLVRHSKVPLLLCRPREEAALSAALPRRILIPLDRSSLSRSILEPATALGDLGKAEYTLFTVVEPLIVVGDPISGAPPPSDPQLTERMRVDAELYVGDTAEELARKGHRVRSCTVVAPGPASAILAEAAAGNYDLIALATHGSGGVRRALLGSVTDKVVRGSTCPVLVLRPGEGDR